MRGFLKAMMVGMLLAAASSASGQGQSYSVSIVPGWNSIANHLNVGGNRIEEVLPSVPEGTEVWKFDARTQRYVGPAEYIAGEWFIAEPEVETLSPGEGALLRSDTQFTLTFRGTPQQPRMRTDVYGGYNLVSCQAPSGAGEECSFEDVFGFRPAPGDRVYKLRAPIPGGTGNPDDIASSIHKYTASGWDSVPSFDLGRSAFVYLGGPPRIIAEPEDQTVLAGTTVRMPATVVGDYPLSYEWRFRGQAIPEQTSPTLTFQPVALSNAGPYCLIVANNSGAVTTRLARLKVVSPPRILEQPRPQVRIVGQTAIFKVLAEGNPALMYQWFFEGNALPRETNAMLMISNISTNNEGKYWVEISNALGKVTSSSAALTVLIPPYIITQPRSADANINDSVTFFVQADGTQPLHYQWLRNGVIIPGATNNALRIQGVEPEDGGSYRVVVHNVAGSVQSDMAFLRVNVPFRSLADNFANAPFFQEPSALFKSSNRGATREPGEPAHAGKPGGKSVWLAWMSPQQQGIVTFRTHGSHFDTLLAAYTGNHVGNLVEVASNDDSASDFLNSEISFNVIADKPYFIAIDGYNGSEGEILVEWFFEATPERLPVILQQPVDQVIKRGGDVTFMVQTDSPNVSYQWFFNGEPIQDANSPVLTLRNTTDGSAGLYYVAVGSGRRATLSRMASLQFSAVGPAAEVRPLFARDKFGDVVARPTQFAGNAMAAMAMAGPPPVHGYNGAQVFSTYGAIKEEGEPDHCDVPGGASYWFTYIPPSSGQMFLNSDGSSFDTLLAVYTATGPYFSNLVEVACDNNSGANGLTSSLNFLAIAGVNYYVVIDGVAAATGSVQLNYTLLVPMMISNVALTNSFSFRVTATPSFPFTIQRSSNLTTWTSVLTTNTESGVFDYLDPTSVTQRFYRVRQIP
jgi:hypothetical protein